MRDLGPAWRVRRTGGLLVPGFRKRFAADGSCGMTSLWRVPIGAFDVVDRADGPGVELQYRRWPIRDVLAQRPLGGGSIRSAGYVVRGTRRIRFCTFRLER